MRMIINVNEDREDRKNIAAIEESGGGGGGGATSTSPSVWYDYSTVLKDKTIKPINDRWIYPSFHRI